MRDDAVPVHLSYRQASDCNSAKAAASSQALLQFAAQEDAKSAYIERCHY